MSRIRRIAPGLGRGGLIGNTEGPESYLRELDTLPSQFCRATGGTETVIEEADESVSLLLNFDGSNGSTTFTDQSIYAHTVTANGNSSISTTQSKFGGSSLALDGTGDYLTIPVNAPTQFGTGDFTLETWCRFDALGGVIADQLPTGATASGWQLYYRSTGSSIAFYANSSVLLQDPSSVRVTTNTWYHIAVTRSGSTARLFIDGEEVASATLTTDLDNGRGVVVGSPQPDRGITNAFFPGYIDSLRIVKGQALYTGNFTPPASAPTNKTGKYYRVHTFTDTDPTSLLLNFDGANGSTTFTDDSGWGHAVTANGDAQISTTESKFGGSSIALLARSDTASLSPSSTFAFGTGDFTVECWFYSTQDETFGGTLFGQTDIGVNYFSFRAGTGDPVQRKMSFRYNTNTEFTHHATYSLNQWHHAAVVRNSGTVHLYLDGVQSTSSASVPFNFTNLTYNPTIGAHSHSTAGAKFFGYIDSLRITKGRALYTSAFTPSTTALTRVGSGSLTFSRGGAVEYLVVGGGGGGWYSGAGAGGLRAGRITAGLSAQVSVGGGGSGGAVGSNGASSFLYSIASAGGAGGKTSTGDGKSGGCGGGAASGANQPAYSGGSGNTPSVSPPQGFDGGDSAASGANTLSTGGGGGAGGAGQTGGTGGGGNGGQGQSSSISGTSTAYSGGGGGAGTVSGGVGGVGGGGDSGNTGGTTPGEPGEQNTGGGGGGGGSGGYAAAAGGSGGSGIVIARYRITQAEYEAEAA